jgi:hypothetical protein
VILAGIVIRIAVRGSRFAVREFENSHEPSNSEQRTAN